MKKYFWMLGSVLMSLAVSTSCSTNDEDANEVTEMAKNYFTVSNASYVEGEKPVATTEEGLVVEVDTETAKGGKNVIKIARDRVYTRFFIGVKGVPGYWVYTPSTVAAIKGETTRSDDEDEEDWDDFYEIVVNNSNGSVDNYTLQVSGEDEQGGVSQTYEVEINYTDEAQAGFPTSIVGIMDGYSYLCFKMKYDDLGRLTLWEEYYDEYLEYSWQIDYAQRTITEYDEGDRYVYRYTTDSQGRIIRMGDNELTATYQYNNLGHLTKVTTSDEEGTFSTNFTWADGNLIRVADEDGVLISASYGTDVNMGHHPSIAMFAVHCEEPTLMTELFGTTCKNLPVTVFIAAEDDYDEEVTERYSYTFNPNGTIETEQVNDGEIIFKHNYAGGSKVKAHPDTSRSASSSQRSGRKGISLLGRHRRHHTAQ